MPSVAAWGQVGGGPVSSVRGGGGRQVGEMGRAEHGRPCCCSQGFGLSHRSGEPWKGLPRCSQSDLCLRQLPPAAVWGVRIDIEEAGSLGKKG